MDSTSEQINLDITEGPRGLPFELPNNEWETYLEKGITTLLVESNRLKQELENESLDSHEQKKGLLLRILEVTDAFDRAIEMTRQMPDVEDRRTHSTIINFQSIHSMLSNVLEEEGVKLMEFVDGIAKISECKVVRAEKKDVYPDLTILETIEKGYYWKDKILRKASVVVAKS